MVYHNLASPRPPLSPLSVESVVPKNHESESPGAQVAGNSNHKLGDRRARLRARGRVSKTKHPSRRVGRHGTAKLRAVRPDRAHVPLRVHVHRTTLRFAHDRCPRGRRAPALSWPPSPSRGRPVAGAPRGGPSGSRRRPRGAGAPRAAQGSRGRTLCSSPARCTTCAEINRSSRATRASSTARRTTRRSA